MKSIALSANTSWYLFNFRKNTIIKLIQEGYKVYAISPADAHSDKFKNLGCQHIHINIEQGGTNPFKEISSLIEYIKIYHSLNLNFAFHFTPKSNIYGSLACAFLNIKCANNISGLGKAFVNKTPLTFIVSNLYKISLQKAVKVFFQNKDDLDYFVKEKIVSKGKAEYIPGSGVDLIRFKPSKLKSPAKPFLFLLIARLIREKGIYEYAEAAEKLQKKYNNTIECRIIGIIDEKHPSGIPLNQINTWVDLGYIKYLGRAEKIEDFIASSHCIVLPSYYAEGCPKSLLEGAAMGKPIITTNHKGCKDTVDHGKNGFLCEKESSSDLFEKMETMYNLPEEKRILMGEHSRKKMENEYDENIVINKYLSVIH